LPANLFRWYPSISVSTAFLSTLRGCTGITSLPADLFRYNTSVINFRATFRESGITSIPVDLFRYNTAVAADGFYDTFRGCTGITSIPADIFRYNVNVSTNGFYYTFGSCSNLATLPALLFKYNVACTSFQDVFRVCNKLQLRADLFFDTGEESTRFLNQSVVFTDAMRIGTFTGDQGTAPALWDCDFGTGTPTKTNCFAGHSTDSVDNYGDIPADWR
jgi:hypothetical protein